MKKKLQTFGYLLLTLMVALGAARAGSGRGEELAVVQAVASIMNRDAVRPFDFLYFESDFPANPYVASSMSNPERTQFCGLSREQAQAMVRELSHVSAERVQFDKALAKSAGLSLGHKKLERFRYLTLSRVVFSPDKRQAWLAVDLDGASGAVYRVDKIDGEWRKTARCGGWLKTE